MSDRIQEQEQEQVELDSQGLNSQSLEGLARQLTDLDEEAFRQRYPCAFLAVQHGPPRGSHWIDLKTSEASKASMPRPRDLVNPQLAIRTIPLLKSERNAFGSKITVGRARNNDVIIRAPKISKLHSYFAVDPQGDYKLVDMGSLNGSVVNGVRVKKKGKVKLASGDLISFWRYGFEFISLDDMIGRLGTK
jgi:hypothetical protein